MQHFLSRWLYISPAARNLSLPKNRSCYYLVDNKPFNRGSISGRFHGALWPVYNN